MYLYFCFVLFAVRGGIRATLPLQGGSRALLRLWDASSAGAIFSSSSLSFDGETEQKMRGSRKRKKKRKRSRREMKQACEGNRKQGCGVREGRDKSRIGSSPCPPVAVHRWAPAPDGAPLRNRFLIFACLFLPPQPPPPPLSTAALLVLLCVLSPLVVEPPLL